MESDARILAALGALLLSGLAVEALGRRTRLPRVSLLVILGLLVGPEGLDLLPEGHGRWFELVTVFALAMVGFVLGAGLDRRVLRHHGAQILILSIALVLGTVVVVAAGLTLLGAPVVLALLLGAVATATDPLATLDVLKEVRSRDLFSRLITGIVALDDVWGVILFSLVLSFIGVIEGGSAPDGVLLHGLVEVLGAILLGVLLGLPLALLSGRLRPGEPTLLEALGATLFCGGAAGLLGVSPILATMTMGAMVGNLARHHTRPVKAIEGAERPFLVVFFVLAGASLDLDVLAASGVLGVSYILLRAAGRVTVVWFTASFMDLPRVTARWLGPALMPQAGVALGLALIGAQAYPEGARALISIAVAGTVFFELAGPVATRLAALRVHGALRRAPTN